MINEIEKSILEEIRNLHGDKLKTIIENLPINKRRIAMFAAICSKKDGKLKEMIKILESTNKIEEIDKVIFN